MSRRRGFTLIELLVTMISGSVILIGLASLATQMVTDQRDITVNRESYYSRARVNAEVTWTMRQVPRRGLRQVTNDVVNVQGPSIANLAGLIGAQQAGVGGPDFGDTDFGNPPAPRGKRGVITYVRDAYTQTDIFNSPGQDPPQALNTALRFTGMIFLYYNTVYRYECPISHYAAVGGSGASFNDPTMDATAIKTWCTDLTKLKICEVLGTGIETFDVAYVNDNGTTTPPSPLLDPSVQNSVRWNVSVAR